MTRKRKSHELINHPRYGGRWTPEADEIIYEYYGKRTTREVASRINTAMGTNFTVCAVYTRACKTLGIDGRTAPGLMTLSEASRHIGLEVSVLRRWLARNGQSLQGSGKHRYLSEKTWMVVRERYKTPPEPCITTAEAATRLSYTRQNITEVMIPDGRLRAWRFGTRWMVSLADVERAARIQAGRTRIGDMDERTSK